jgi:hypothetical protein
MAVTADQPAPYAPAPAVLGLIERHRTKGLPSPVDADVLGRAGISASLIARTLYALQVLDLISEDGRPTSILEGIRLAPEAEYKQRLVDWLSGAYADALQFVDPATDDETKVRDAFRSYKPIGQQSRMVTMFMGLFAAAGAVPERQKPQPRKSGSIQPQKVRTQPKPKTTGGSSDGGTSGGSSGKKVDIPSDSLPPPLAGMLTKLPPDGEAWTKTDRDRFMVAFGAVLDFCYPIAPIGRQKSAPQAEAGVDEM